MTANEHLASKLWQRASGYFNFLPVDERQSDYLASWRGGSAIVVLIGHSIDIFVVKPHPIWSVLSTGAVLIFFGLSGFFIHKALARSLSVGQAISFLVGRVNRVVPPFAFSLALVVMLWALAPSVFLSGDRSFITATARSELSLKGIGSSALFLNGFIGPTLSANGPLWSLSYEIWYYVAAFLVGVAVLRRHWWPLGGALILLVGLTLANPKFALLGVVWLFGFLLSAIHGLDRVPKLPEWPFAIIAIAGVVLAALVTFKGAQLLSNLTVGCWFVVHMSRVLRGHVPWISTMLERSSHWAYALYVLHFPLLLFAYGATGERAWVGIPVTALVLVLVATFGRRLESIRLISARSKLARGR